MNDSQPPSPRRRLQTLLAIPERQRTDAEWDEINELEIVLAPHNRQQPAAEQSARGNAAPTGPTGQPKPGNGPRGKKPMRNLHKRRRKGNGNP